MCFACGQVLAGPEQTASGDPGISPTGPYAEPAFDSPLPPAGSAHVPPPAPGQADQVWATGTARPPWEERRRYGFFVALWLTWRDSVFKPVPFFRSLPPRGGLGPAIGYTLLMTVVALAFNFYWDMLRTAISGNASEGLATTLLGGLMLLLIGGGFILLLYVGLLFLLVALIHIGLMITGSGRMGYEGTFRSVAYAAGPAAFAIFPFFGSLLSLVWASVIMFIAVREVQRTTNGRAAIAFLVPLVASIVFFFILGILAVLIIGTADLTAV
jgi:hypothetical protein